MATRDEALLSNRVSKSSLWFVPFQVVLHSILPVVLILICYEYVLLNYHILYSSLLFLSLILLFDDVLCLTVELTPLTLTYKIVIDND